MNVQESIDLLSGNLMAITIDAENNGRPVLEVLLPSGWELPGVEGRIRTEPMRSNQSYTLYSVSAGGAGDGSKLYTADQLIEYVAHVVGTYRQIERMELEIEQVRQRNRQQLLSTLSGYASQPEEPLSLFDGNTDGIDAGEDRGALANIDSAIDSVTEEENQTDIND